MAISLKQFAKRGWNPEHAKKIRELIIQFTKKHPMNVRPTVTMGKISDLVDGFGVESIPPGHSSQSPEITYVNMGDPYAETVMYVNGRFRLGYWGDIVERGSYD